MRTISLPKYLFIVCFLLLNTTVGPATEKGYAAIKGNIVLEDGSAIPGVTIRISAPKKANTIQPRTTISNEKGTFYFSHLPAGIYFMRCNLEGFKTIKNKVVVLKAGETKNIQLIMKTGLLLDERHHVCNPPLVNNRSIQQLYSLKTWLLSLLPNNVTGAKPFPFIKENEEVTVYVEGINLNNPYSGEEDIDLDQETVAEVKLEDGALPPTTYRNSGRVSNLILKRGQDFMHGSVSLHYQPKLSCRTPSLNLGGPVVRDRVWFFAGMSRLHNREETEGFSQGFSYVKELDVPRIFTALSVRLSSASILHLKYHFTNRKITNNNASLFKAPETLLNTKLHHHFFNFGFFAYLSNSMDFGLKLGWNSRKERHLANQEAKTGAYVMVHNLDTLLDNGSFYIERQEDKSSRFHIVSYIQGFLESPLGDQEFRLGVRFQQSRYHIEKSFNPDVGTGFSRLHIQNGENGPAAVRGFYYEDMKSRRIMKNGEIYLMNQWSYNYHLMIQASLQ